MTFCVCGFDWYRIMLRAISFISVTCNLLFSGEEMGGNVALPIWWIQYNQNITTQFINFSFPYVSEILFSMHIVLLCIWLLEQYYLRKSMLLFLLIFSKVNVIFLFSAHVNDTVTKTTRILFQQIPFRVRKQKQL